MIVLTDRAEIIELLEMIGAVRFHQPLLKENDSYAGDYCRITLFNHDIAELSLDVRYPFGETDSAKAVASAGVAAYNAQNLFEYIDGNFLRWVDSI